jgi:cation transport ATPase
MSENVAEGNASMRIRTLHRKDLLQESFFWCWCDSEFVCLNKRQKQQWRQSFSRLICSSARRPADRRQKHIKGEVFDENFLMSIASIGAFAIGEFPEAVAVMLFYQAV